MNNARATVTTETTRRQSLGRLGYYEQATDHLDLMAPGFWPAPRFACCVAASPRLKRRARRVGCQLASGACRRPQETRPSAGASIVDDAPQKVLRGAANTPKRCP